MARKKSIPGADRGSIVQSMREFDLGRKLTDEEALAAGQMLANQERLEKELVEGPVLHDIEEDGFASSDSVSVPAGTMDYNRRYAHYMKCQSIATLAAFEEGWKAFEEMVLNAYVQMRRREDSEYSGEDPNRAFLIRARKREAEDFVKYIRASVEESKSVQKPILPSNATVQ